MEKSSDASPEKPDEQTHDNGIPIDKEDETRPKVEPILVGRSDNSSNEKTSQPVEDEATRVSNGEGSCLLSSDEIKQIVANFLATLPSESSRFPSVDLRPSSDNFLRTSIGKEQVDNGITKFGPGPGRSSKHNSEFSRLSSGMKKKAYAKSKSSGSYSRKNKTPHSRHGREVPEPVTIAIKSNPAARASSSKERRGKKKNKFRENATDVFTKMRNHVRYILNKIKYEQSLIDAYGGEGWKGLSIDKLKPEKELQRASSEIHRRKLRLRELFQRLDALCAEGAYPKSMFDSEGLLNTEDIYCTICGSKEVSANNDIVLCDGECNRAFHQLCLKPPLLTEEIPPEDQGWLCPGCDCKFDCIELVNDFFGSEISMKDDWTRIFPEAAAAGANILDEILRLPSDDSEDDDFNPENMYVEEKDQSGEKCESYEGEESASDESDFSSASEDLGDFINKGHLVEKLTNNAEEDDEDDDEDYDPEAPDNMDVGEKVGVEKLTGGDESSDGEGSASDESDFSSASEDFGDFVCKQLAGNNIERSDDTDDDFDPDAREPDQLNEEASSSSDFPSDSNAINAELANITSTKNSDIVVAETEQESPVPGSKKRGIERLDYKKLHDEAYGNMSSDSSDDEDWSEVGPFRKKKDQIKRDGSTTLKSKERGLLDEEQPRDIETKPQETKNGGASRRSGKKQKSSSENGSIEKGSRSSLGETAIHKLKEAFQKNQYPERAVKEGLANDLGLSYQKVEKWFGNARWSFNHPLHARIVSKSNLATKSPPQTKSGSQLAVNNSNKTHSSKNQPGAKTTVSDTSVKISSTPSPTSAKTKGKKRSSQNRPEPMTPVSDTGTPYKISSPPNPTSAKAKGQRGRGRGKTTSPNSSTTITTNQGEASNTPLQPAKRRSSRFQESATSNASRDDANNGGRGSSNAGESSATKGNRKQKGQVSTPSITNK